MASQSKKNFRLKSKTMQYIKRIKLKKKLITKLKKTV